MTDRQGQGGYAKGVYRMGEVCTLTGLESHVLRYWETEFAQLSPNKSRGGQRLYRPADIDLVLRIRDLLHVEGYTIVGARRRLQALDDDAGALGACELLDASRSQVQAILTMLEANDTL